MQRSYETRLKKLEASVVKDLVPTICFISKNEDGTGFTANLGLWNFKEGAANKNKTVVFKADSEDKALKMVRDYLDSYPKKHKCVIFTGFDRLEG